MIDRATKLRWRRKMRRSRKQVEEIGFQAEEHLERHFIRRLSRLYQVKRFVGGWIALLALLIAVVVSQTRALSVYYQRDVPAPGGTYSEGVIGAFTNANPIYATGGVDSSVSKLVFSGLLKYSQSNRLVGDIAEKWSVDGTNKRYTVVLKDNVYWHDGHKLTAKDVVFTYSLIQDPEARSPLLSSWRGVKVSAKDDHTVVFELPSILSAFPHSLTNGIVPEHVLKDKEPGQLRSDLFNTLEPIGTGPFKWDAIEAVGGTPETREERIGLTPHDKYHLGEPKLQRLVIRTFRDEQRLIDSFLKRELNAMVGLKSVPDTLSNQRNITEYSVPMTAQVASFFNTSNETLSDAKVRQALVRAVDTGDLVNSLGYPVIKSDSPFLRGHFAYDSKRTQLGQDVKAAQKLLDEAGWKRAKNQQIRQKNGKPLKLNLYAQGTSDFAYVTQKLQQQWRAVGAEVNVMQPTDSEFQSIVALHNYDILLYGISLGNDPDVFAYWHSSQADPRSATRLNLSEWENSAADVALEGGRTRTDARLRKAKYQPFLDAWRQEAPALALYQPRFLYVVGGDLYNFTPSEVNDASDRYNNVHNWMVRQTKVNK